MRRRQQTFAEFLLDCNKVVDILLKDVQEGGIEIFPALLGEIGKDFS